MLGFILAGFFAGALALVMADNGPWRREDILFLAVWPVAVLVLWPTYRVKRARRTCRVCKKRYLDRAALGRHVVNEHDTVRA